MTKTYFRRADGVMLLYDVTSDRSFAAVRHWIQNIDVSIIVKKTEEISFLSSYPKMSQRMLKSIVITDVQGVPRNMTVGE